MVVATSYDSGMAVDESLGSELSRVFLFGKIEKLEADLQSFTFLHTFVKFEL